MSEREFLVRNEYVPHWRARRKRLHRLAYDIALPTFEALDLRLVRLPLAAISLLTVLLLLLPPAQGYNLPLSVLFAQRDVTACLIFAGMVGAVGCLGMGLLLRGRWAASIPCVAICWLLFTLFRTHPFSSDHLSAFVILALVVVGAHWLLSAAFEDLKLVLLSGAATLSAVLCPVAMGIGERLLIFVSLVTVQLLLREHLS